MLKTCGLTKRGPPLLDPILDPFLDPILDTFLDLLKTKRKHVN
jgi:hypothetical protein